MAQYYSIALLFVSIFLHFLVVKCKSPLAPALYVFGDSLSDCGNNNFLQTDAKVNYKPYGIDFPSGVTGRYTNGKTFADFIAEFLGLPLVPPYLGLSTVDKINLTTGVNYASGASGILPETGTATGGVISLDEQINYFWSTVTTDLLNIFKTPSAFFHYMSKSIFLVNIGNNDYINNYLQPANYRSSQIYTPQRFAHLLISGLRLRLTRLYILGARKFVVFNIARLGCVPGIVNAANPKPTTPCVEDVNNLVLLFNTRLPSMISTLERSLHGSTFVRGDGYGINRSSSQVGFTAPQTLCCDIRGVTGGLCRPNSKPCSDRTKYVFWDAFHPTQVVINGQATDCFNGSVSCVPINVRQLAKKR